LLVAVEHCEELLQSCVAAAGAAPGLAWLVEEGGQHKAADFAQGAASGMDCSAFWFCII